MSEDLRYPVGKFSRPTRALTAAERTELIDTIANAPAKLRDATKGLTDAQLDTPYRPGGWTARQVVHHVADSHINAYCRFKLALTEDVPTIKPYEEAKWAELSEARTAPVDVSHALIGALHERWTLMLRGMQGSDFERKLNHPEWEKPLSLDFMLALYGWHCRHHTAHVTELRRREGW